MAHPWVLDVGNKSEERFHRICQAGLIPISCNLHNVLYIVLKSFYRRKEKKTDGGEPTRRYFHDSSSFPELIPSLVEPHICLLNLRLEPGGGNIKMVTIELLQTSCKPNGFLLSCLGIVLTQRFSLGWSQRSPVELPGSQPRLSAEPKCLLGNIRYARGWKGFSPRKLPLWLHIGTRKKKRRSLFLLLNDTE